MSDEIAVTDEAPAQAATPVEPARKFAELDAVLPDDYDDEDFRGKPLNEVLRVAKQYKQEIGVSRKKSMEYNALNEKVSALERAIEFSKRNPERPPASREEDLNRFNQAPRRFVEENVKGVRDEVEDVKFQLYSTRAEMARERAMRQGGFDPEAWEDSAPAIAAFMQANNLDGAVAANWLKAAERFKPVLTKKVEVPTQGAPPAGQARSNARPSSSSGPRFATSRAENAAKDAAAMMGYKPGTDRYKALMEELAKEGDE
jgi:hypothetical protein